MATTNYSWNLPTVGGSEDTWGTQLNANWTALDTLLGGANATEFAKLDGLTATTVELNHLGGVTSGVQTQFNAITSRTISAGDGLTGGGDLSANRTISHADTSSQGSVNNSGLTFIQDITLDTYGHVTAIGSATAPQSIGEGQTWRAVSRANGTSYQNTTGRAIMVQIDGRGGGMSFQTSTDNVNWVTHYTWSGGTGDLERAPLSSIIPPNHYYRTISGSGFHRWTELR